MTSPYKTASEREGTGVGLLHDGQVDSCPVWFQVLIYNPSSTNISWLATGTNLEFEKGWPMR